MNHIVEYPADQIALHYKYPKEVDVLSTEQVYCIITKDGRVWDVAKDTWAAIDTTHYVIVHNLAGRTLRFCMYRIMAVLWVPNPYHRLYVVAKDGNKANYTISNLAWSNIKQYRIGQVFSRLTILEELPIRNILNSKIRVICRCSCGKMVECRLAHVVAGKIVSCGCYNRERAAAAKYKHGYTDNRLYNILVGMHTRCSKAQCKGYDNYGGRGISVCPEWSLDEPGISAFIDWATSHGYTDKLTIDRIDNDGNYEPSNCR